MCFYIDRLIMGIILATCRPRIGLDYYRMCHPLQTRWRSSGGLLYKPEVIIWGVGEVMNDTPLVLKGCMTVFALSLILQYVVYSWSKLKGRSGTVHCHQWVFTSQVRTSLLTVAVILGLPRSAYCGFTKSCKNCI